MEQVKYVKKFSIWTAIICAAIFAVWNVLDFHMIEATMFEEVAKRVVVSAGVIGIVILPLTVFIIAPFCYHIKHDKKK